MADRLLVLGWHNVASTWLFPSNSGAGPKGMERQLRFLRRSTNVVDLREALAALTTGRPLPPRAVAITFDDGYRDQLELAVPMLERLGLPATFFLVPGLLDRTVPAWWEELAWTFTRATRRSVVWEGRTLALADAAERRPVILLTDHVGTLGWAIGLPDDVGAVTSLPQDDPPDPSVPVPLPVTNVAGRPGAVAPGK